MDQRDDFIRTSLRIPKDLWERLGEAAGRKRSLNAEIIERLEQSFTARDPFADLATPDEWFPVPDGREIERQTAEVIMDPRVRLAMRIAMRSYGMLAKLTPEVLNNDKAITILERAIATNPGLLDGADYPGTGRYADPADAPQAASDDEKLQPVRRPSSGPRKRLIEGINDEPEDVTRPRKGPRPWQEVAKERRAKTRAQEAEHQATTPTKKPGTIKLRRPSAKTMTLWQEKAARRRARDQTED